MRLIICVTFLIGWAGGVISAKLAVNTEPPAPQVETPECDDAPELVYL